LDYVGSATVVSSAGIKAHFHRAEGQWSVQFSSENVDELLARTWFEGAWEIEALAGAHWDDPRPDDKDSALTASIAWRNQVESTTQFAAAFHIAQRGIERFIHELPIGEKGEVLLFARDGLVMRLSKALANYVQLTPRNEFFSTSDDPGETVAGGLQVIANEVRASEPMRWNREGEPWWFVANLLTIGDRTIQVGLASRERTLLADLKQNELFLIYLLFAVLALGVVSIILLARQLPYVPSRTRESSSWIAKDPRSPCSSCSERTRSFSSESARAHDNSQPARSSST